MHVTLATFLTLKTNICHEKERVFVSVSPEEEIIQRTIQVFSYNPNTVQVINDFSVMVFFAGFVNSAERSVRYIIEL